MYGFSTSDSANPPMGQIHLELLEHDHDVRAVIEQMHIMIVVFIRKGLCQRINRREFVIHNGPFSSV